ncbi:MAG: RimK family alpha-L-glutamate ligase, partial [Actinobacteria bacterium]|nr:RimK family alpha-L-glutamate ligase [Actinomycetota bacterium]
LSLAACRLVGADHAGVDILPTADGGYTVLEVNTIPGWRELRAVTGLDVPALLVEHVLEALG